MGIPGSESANCNTGYIEYRDYGLPYDDSQHHRYCNADGQGTPPDFFSLTDTMQILLRNRKDQNVSFTIQYKDTDCSRTYTTNSSRIFSPGWPHHYSQYLNCRITITAALGNKIQFYFNEFDVEDPGDCNMNLCDYLDIYVGSAINADNKLGRFAGNALPDPLFPETNQMLLHFVTDQLVSGKGFDVSYCSDPNGCGGDLSGTHGNMYLSGYPQDPYPAGQTCIWVIEVPPTRRVKIHFRNINVRYNAAANSCVGDAIYAYNGRWGQSTSFIVGYCGRGQVNDVQGNSHLMSLRWLSQAGTSDESRAGYTGFWIEWES